MAQEFSPAKITPPALSGIVSRKRLFRQIDAGRKRPIIWICGPPGSGKTTLAASYLKDRNLPCLWYRLDEGDDDAGSFFYYMGLAARTAAPRKLPRNRRPLPLLSPENLLALPTFTRRYFQDLYERLKAPSAIVFDNYHDVPAGSLLHKLIHDGLNEVPSGVNVIFTSRHAPPPSIADFRSKGMVEIIPWNSLSLTIKETEVIVKTHRKGLNFSVDAIDTLHRRSGGWVAGLLLLLTERKKPEDSYINLETPEVVFDYLAGEVFERNDDQTKTFLLKTAFLPGMTARMAEELTGIPDSRRILTYLHNNNLFIEKSSDPEPSYQYHPLFQEFLLSRAKARFTGDAIAMIRRDAAGILESAGLVENALGLYIDAGDLDNAIRLICTQAPSLMAQGRVVTISTWLSRLPQGVIDQTPWLLYWKGILNLISNQRESQSCFERAWHLFDTQKDTAGIYLSWCGVVNSIFHAFEDFSKFDRWIILLDEISAKYPAFPSGDIRARVTYTMFLALIYRNPMHPDFHAWAEEAIEIFHHDRDSCLRMEVAFHLVCYHHMLGDFARASLIVEQLRESAVSLSETAPLSLLGWKATVAFYSWLIGSPEECLTAVHEGLKVSEDTGVHHLDYVLLGQGVSCSLSFGNLTEARRLLKKMASSLERGSRNDRCFYHFVAAWEALLREDVPHAMEHAKSGLKLVAELGTSWQMFLAKLMMAQTLHEKGEERKAADYLSQAKQFAGLSKSPFFEYMCNLSSAQFAIDRGDEESCLETLGQAMTIGKEKGIVNLWGWRPDVMTRLCAKALDAGIEVEYVQKVIRSRKLLPLPSSFYIDNWPWTLKIYTLGRFELVKDGKPIQFTKKVPQKTLDLLKALIASGGRNVGEDQLTDLLWQDADGYAAHKSFEITLCRLRKLIGIDKAIQLKESILTIDSGYCWVDAWAFERLIGEAERTIRKEGFTEGSVKAIEHALSMYHGAFLSADREKPWAVSVRDRLRSKFLRQVRDLGSYWEKRGEFEKAIECFQKGLEVDNRYEEFYQHLMTCLIRLGRTSEALANYHRCKSILSAELGINPSAKIEALYKAVLTSP